MEFTGVENCGNSPKNLRLAEWERALALGAWNEVDALLADDAVIEIARGGELERVELRALRDLRGDLVGGSLESAITHGKDGATWGSWERPSGTAHFAHVFRFATTKGDRVAQVRVIEAGTPLR